MNGFFFLFLCSINAYSVALFNDFNNSQVANLPLHLRKYIVDQQYDKYTPVDHAVWRYVMRQNYSYLKDVAYYPYIPGLKKAGLTIEKIPSLQEINDALAEIGWGAVTVDGFIPPAAFMEYQAYRVLVIAADIRQLEHIEYTSAPDIILDLPMPLGTMDSTVVTMRYSYFWAKLVAVVRRKLSSRRNCVFMIDSFVVIRYIKF